jgi:hypothetical protein
MGNVAACYACGEAIDPKWTACPYCGAAQGEAGPKRPGHAPPTGVAAAAAIDYENKTVSININEMQAGKKRELVGWIVAVNGNHRGEDFKIYDGKNLLGTAADCDIVITDPYLSAKHCTIKHENGNFVLIDLDSTNGTYVNQKRVTKMELIDNDTVRLGRTEFKFKSLF